MSSLPESSGTTGSAIGTVGSSSMIDLVFREVVRISSELIEQIWIQSGWNRFGFGVACDATFDGVHVHGQKRLKKMQLMVLFVT